MYGQENRHVSSGEVRQCFLASRVVEMLDNGFAARLFNTPSMSRKMTEGRRPRELALTSEAIRLGYSAQLCSNDCAIMLAVQVHGKLLADHFPLGHDRGFE